jgi:hypothetical protein
MMDALVHWTLADFGLNERMFFIQAKDLKK